MEELVYFNGDLVPSSRVNLSPFDFGFLYGCGLFETMRVYNGSIFRLGRHLTRLRRSAEVLGIASKLVLLDLEKSCYEVLRVNELTEARLRLTVSAGEGGIIPDLATCDSITVFIVARKLVPLPSESYERGFNVVLSSWRCSSQSPLLRLKSTCYMENVLAKQEAKAAGADEALFLNERGLLTESSTANIFLVSKGMLVTPSVESGVLPGITREAVLELAQRLGIEAIEREVKPKELVEADEAFLTNSIFEIMPLTWLGEKPIGSGKPGELSQRLMSAYKEMVVGHNLSSKII